jgi:hypothetical protein
VTAYISHHDPAVNRGIDACPGIDERGHGLTMTLIHDATCCQEWESGITPWPARAKAWVELAERKGSTWPRPDREPEAGQ